MILLGITTLLSAWVSWIAHLHGGLQSINFTQSNNSASEATAQYNYAIQSYLADYMAWNTLRDYQYELDVAKAEGNQTKIDLCTDKIEAFKKDTINGIIEEGIKAFTANRYSLAFLAGGSIIALLYIFRGINARLILKDDEIFFWDGVANIRHIKYQQIASIRYNPALRIRFQMRDRNKTVFTIPNMFTQEDAEEFLSKIARHKWITIEHTVLKHEKGKASTGRGQTK